MKWPLISWTSFSIKPKMIKIKLDLTVVIYVKLRQMSESDYRTNSTHLKVAEQWNAVEVAFKYLWDHLNYPTLDCTLVIQT